MKTKIVNGSVYYKGMLQELELLLKDGVIEKIAPLIEESADTIIDAGGLLVSPGLVDIHVHLREPGGEAKETIKTGTRSAARGGFTSICAMPNTRPVPDSKEKVEELYAKIEQDALVHVYPYGAITKNQVGKDLVPFEDLDVFAFTDDGVGVKDAGVMYEAMKRAANEQKAIVAHCEDLTLVNGGAMHDGERAKELGIKGITSMSESVHVARDILLAEAAGVHYHVCHVSTKESVRVIRDAKRAGINVTAEVSPHHLLLNENDVINDANFKMNPPLRSKEDQEALVRGLLDGTLDCIATDHAPHTEDEKRQPFEEAPFGIVGLETAFPLLHTFFVETKQLDVTQLLDFLTKKPAEVFGLKAGVIEVGAVADLTLIDLNREETVRKEEFYSKGRNTPFDGYKLKGIPVTTIVRGEVVYSKEEALV
ncbi:dihydroorotase [Paenalkalicoccus suaedae]|uniref:Dihydroorotase n=1 Tax=Paenalkalicoccus suaedae TaxID=2592382 RepID=A0A859FF65_9BACI|nr:dihydroorotase [Paenalkalicoccus suaedae]QKS71500.1 dihydroorotase [Paenalkalicoccus suaedae]